MSIGLGIFLFVVGAILVFALEVTVDWIDLNLVGYILMGAGAVIFVLGLVFLMRRRNSVSTTRTIADPANGEQITRRQSSIDDRDLQ
jgi:membrane-bound ClpP family serine protease